MPIAHRVTWLISVLLQAQRCQAGAAGLPWIPSRPLILQLQCPFPALAHLAAPPNSVSESAHITSRFCWEEKQQQGPVFFSKQSATECSGPPLTYH